MLTRNYRLKKDCAFKATFALRNFTSDKNFVVYFGKSKPSISLFTKFGFVISKKNYKRAVKRNRLKRLLREYFRLKLKTDPNFLSKYISVVVYVKNPLENLNFKEISTQLEKLICFQ